MAQDLENELEAQLKATRIVRSSIAIDLAEGGGRHGCIESIRAIGIGEPDAVELVDELRPELQPRKFGNRRVLDDGEVEVVLPRIAHQAEPVRERPHIMVKLLR